MSSSWARVSNRTPSYRTGVGGSASEADAPLFAWTHLGVAEGGIVRSELFERLLVRVGKDDRRAVGLEPYASISPSVREPWNRRPYLAKGALVLLVERPQADGARMARAVVARPDAPVLDGPLCADEADLSACISLRIGCGCGFVGGAGELGGAGGDGDELRAALFGRQRRAVVILPGPAGGCTSLPLLGMVLRAAPVLAVLALVAAAGRGGCLCCVARLRLRSRRLRRLRRRSGRVVSGQLGAERSPAGHGAWRDGACGLGRESTGDSARAAGAREPAVRRRGGVVSTLS